MGVVSLNFGQSGSGSDDVTATMAQLLQGFTAITNDSDDEPIEGTMIDNGAVSQILTPSTPSITIPQGYHNGQGQVSISPQTKTIAPTTSTQNITPDSGKVLSKVTVNAINTQEKTASATTSAQAITPDSGRYLSRVNIRALSQTNLASENIIRGKTITINNGANDVWSVAGNSAVMKMISGTVGAGSTDIGYAYYTALNDGSSQYNTFYKQEIARSITPVYVLTLQQDSGYYTIYDYTTGQFYSYWSAPCRTGTFATSILSSSQITLLFPIKDKSYNYYVFGY